MCQVIFADITLAFSELVFRFAPGGLDTRALGRFLKKKVLGARNGGEWSVKEASDPDAQRTVESIGARFARPVKTSFADPW